MKRNALRLGVLFLFLCVFFVLVPSRGETDECAAGVCPLVPEMAAKVREARSLLAVEPLEKEIESISVKSSKQKSKKKRAPSVSVLKQKRLYRLKTAEFMIAVEDGDTIKKILLRETLPPFGSSGFVFEVIDSDFDCELSVEYAGGVGINRRYFVFCEGEGEKKQFLASSGFFARENIFSSRADAESKIRRITYSPFAEEYATPEMVVYGDFFVRISLDAVFKKLEAKKVFSRAYPGKLVSEAHHKNISYILLISEHCDHDEFDAWGAEFCVKKVLTTIALNEESVYPTMNRSGAAGAMQITDNRKKIKKDVYKDGTYTMVRRAYPDAGLIPEFPKGAYDFENALMTEVLLWDYELSKLPQWVRDAYTKDPRLVVLCLATAYHSGGGVAGDLCAKPTKAVSLDAFQFPRRFQRIAPTKKTRGQEGKPELEYYLRKFIALEKLNPITIEVKPL